MLVPDSRFTMKSSGAVLTAWTSRLLKPKNLISKQLVRQLLSRQGGWVPEVLINVI